VIEIRLARKREFALDFLPIEIEVLELAAHYVFYCLTSNRQSPFLEEKSKREYMSRLKDLSRLGQPIRIGKNRLSILVEESEICCGVKKEFSKIIEKLEVGNEY
jgi:hypothetical protein